MILTIEGDKVEVSLASAFNCSLEEANVSLGATGLTLAGAVREHDRAFAHRIAWRARAVASLSEGKAKAWPEWKVKAHAESDPEWLRMTEAVVASAYNVMVLESIRETLLARLQAVNSPSRISPAFPMTSR